MNHHKGTEPPIIPKPLRSKEMKQVCSDQWDAEFIDTIGKDRQTLYDLILAANYMDVSKSLLHLPRVPSKSRLAHQGSASRKDQGDPVGRHQGEEGEQGIK